VAKEEGLAAELARLEIEGAEREARDEARRVEWEGRVEAQMVVVRESGQRMEVVKEDGRLDEVLRESGRRIEAMREEGLREKKSQGKCVIM
jgi:hypothetical protein